MWRSPTFPMTLTDIRNPTLDADGLEAWHLLTFTMTVIDVRNPSLVVEGPES